MDKISQHPLVTERKLRSSVRHDERRWVRIPVTAAFVSNPSALPVAPPGGSIVLRARHVELSLKNTGRFVASIWIALIDNEYDFWERPKSRSMLDRAKTNSDPAFSAADSTFRNDNAAG